MSNTLTFTSLVNSTLDAMPVIGLESANSDLPCAASASERGTGAATFFQRRLGQEVAADVCDALQRGQAVCIKPEQPAAKQGYRLRHVQVTPLDSADGDTVHTVVQEVYDPCDEPLVAQLDEVRLLLESAPDATFIFDRDGRLVVANQEAESLFGYSQASLRNLSIEELMPARYRSQHVALRHKYQEKPAVREMGGGITLYALTAQGSEFPADIRLGPITRNGQSFFVASVRNVQARVDAALALKSAKEAAEQAAFEKSRFLAAANHDLRQPLQAISLYLAALARTSDEALHDEIVEKMQQSLGTTQGLLRGLLDVARFDDGRVTPQRSPVDLNRLIREVIATHAPLAEKRNLELTFEHTDAVVDSDPTLLKRILDNLVSNGLRYTRDGGVTVVCVPAGQCVSINVHDSGVGIDNDSLEMIFDAYYQLDNPLRHQAKGLGLGLAIVKHIAELLDHPLSVISTPGEGSTFSISVPVVEGLAAAQRVTSELSALRLDNPLILVVDDDEEVRTSTQFMLESAGARIRLAEGVADALELVDTRQRPDCLVVDYWLDRGNALELIEQLRARAGRDIPAIITTGDTNAVSTDRLALPACSVMFKPIQPDELIAHIHTLCTNSD